MRASVSKLKLGTIIFVVFFVINAMLVQLNVGGLIRELTRLGTIMGLLTILIFGTAKLFKKKSR